MLPSKDSLRSPLTRLLSAVTVALVLAGPLHHTDRLLARVGFPAWSTPETLALTGSSAAVLSASLKMVGGRAAAIWTEDNVSVRAAFRPSGGPFAAVQTLDTQTYVHEPSVAIGSTGKAIAVWGGDNNPGPVRTLAVSDLTAGTSVFGAKATIYTASIGLDPEFPNASIDASGATLVAFTGDGTFGAFRNIWSAERASGAPSFTVTRRTGNFEVGGLKAAAGSDGTAFAYAYGIQQGSSQMIIGPRRNAAGTWFPEVFASPYAGATLNQQAPQSLALDAANNAYLVVDVCCNGGIPGPNLVMVNSAGNPTQGAINPDTAFYTGPTAGGSFPVAVTDGAGNVVMAWIRSTNQIYAAYRPAGTATTFGTAVLIATNVTPVSGHMAIAMDATGNAIVGWKDACVSSVCTLKTRIRPVGAASTFNAAVTVAANVRDDTTLSMAADGANNVGVLWRDSVAPVNLKVSFVNTTLPDHLTITSSTSNLSSGVGRTITAELRDSNNAVVTTDSSTIVSFSQTSGAGTVTGLGSSTASLGIASMTATGGVSGAVTITASVTGLVSGTTTFTVVPGAATQLTFTSSTADLATGANRLLTAAVRDAAGNVVTTDSSTQVNFGQAAGSGSVTGLGVSAAASGIASRTVTGGTAGSITIAAAASGLTTGSTTFNVTTLPTFTDNPISASSTTVKLVHLIELRDAVAALRARYGLSVITWTDASPAAGTTQIKAAHVSELRAALNAVYVAAGRTLPTYTDSTITAGTTAVRASHFNELRAAVLAIW